MPDLLIEIGCEEIPARMIDGARQELAKRVSDLLQRERIAPLAGSITGFSTPRRLAVFTQNVQERQQDVRNNSWAGNQSRIQRRKTHSSC